jgi:membrane protease YdiL (CAAX protease family)
MQAAEMVRTNASQSTEKPKQIASWGHFLGFLLIMAGTAALGFYAQRSGTSNSGATAGQLADHSKAIFVYLVAGFMDGVLFYYCWAGVHRHGGNLSTLSGGRWMSWSHLAADIAIALPFWAWWEGVAYAVHRALGPSGAKSVSDLLPRSLLEIVIWIGVSITAGFCEEIAFRGYLQRQLHALGVRLGVAVVLQALVFGLAHGYQGWKQVVVISILGVLYGALAAWRRNLRVNIIAHAWSDIWGGWLQMVLWK